MRKARKSPKVTRFVGYVRVSTDEQAREGSSLAAQRERITAWCAAMSFDLVRIHRDEGESGAKPPHRRPGLSRALRAVQSNDVDGLIVVRLDRLSRNVPDTLALVDESQKQGWRLASVTEQLDTGTPAGRFVVTVLAALAEMERGRLSERVTETAAHITRQGGVVSGKVPFGYFVVGHPDVTNLGDVKDRVMGERFRLDEDPHEQLIIRRMVRMRDEDGAGTHVIAKRLQEGTWGKSRARRPEPVVNPRTGDFFTRSQVRRILESHDRREAVKAAGAVSP